MNFRWGSAMSVLLLAGAAWIAAPMTMAQEQSQNGPPKYLFTQNISLKPGAMEQFVKLQQEEVTALRDAKAPEHFFAMEQITGTGRVTFFQGYDSFADGMKLHEEMMSNTQLAATLRTDDAAQAVMVRDERDSIYMLRKDLSLHSAPSLEDMRFMRVLVVHVRPGHAADLENIAKVEKKALASEADIHWTVWEEMYGPDSDDTYMVAVPMKSLTEIDSLVANEKTVRGVLGEGLVHLIRSTDARAISSAEENLYVFSTKMSYVPDAWLSASPDFWGKK